MIRAALLFLVMPAAAVASDLIPVPYDSLRSQPHRLETFDTLPSTPEPGITFDHHWRAPGLSIAEHLAGQSVSETRTAEGRFDGLTGAPGTPLRVIAGRAYRNFTIAHHAGFASNALFPVGPAGHNGIDGRGEGSIAMIFDDPQFAFGLRLHAEYADPFGQRPNPGSARITFYDASAHRLASFSVPLTQGVMSLAWRSGSGVAAVTVENSDPGGIAIDDILYAVELLSG